MLDSKDQLLLPLPLWTLPVTDLIDHIVSIELLLHVLSCASFAINCVAEMLHVPLIIGTTDASSTMLIDYDV